MVARVYPSQDTPAAFPPEGEEISTYGGALLTGEMVESPLRRGTQQLVVLAREVRWHGFSARTGRDFHLRWSPSSARWSRGFGGHGKKLHLLEVPFRQEQSTGHQFR
jgi:hypothetical protein